MLPVKKTMTETTVITLKNNLSLIYFWSDFFLWFPSPEPFASSYSPHWEGLGGWKAYKSFLASSSGDAKVRNPESSKNVRPLDRVPPWTEERTLVCRWQWGRRQRRGQKAVWRGPSWSLQPWDGVSAQHREPGSRNLMNPWGQRMRKYLHKRLL